MKYNQNRTEAKIIKYLSVCKYLLHVNCGFQNSRGENRLFN